MRGKDKETVGGGGQLSQICVSPSLLDSALWPRTHTLAGFTRLPSNLNQSTNQYHSMNGSASVL